MVLVGAKLPIFPRGDIRTSASRCQRWATQVITSPLLQGGQGRAAWSGNCGRAPRGDPAVLHLPAPHPSPCTNSCTNSACLRLALTDDTSHHSMRSSLQWVLCDACAGIAPRARHHAATTSPSARRAGRHLAALVRPLSFSSLLACLAFVEFPISKEGWTALRCVGAATRLSSFVSVCHIIFQVSSILLSAQNLFGRL